MSGTTEKDQKTEQPTAKKLADSAREGDVLMSRELATALMMLAAAGWIVAAGGWFVRSASDLVRRGLTLTASDVADFAPGEGWDRSISRGWNGAGGAISKGRATHPPGARSASTGETSCGSRG